MVIPLHIYRKAGGGMVYGVVGERWECVVMLDSFFFRDVALKRNVIRDKVSRPHRRAHQGPNWEESTMAIKSTKAALADA